MYPRVCISLKAIQNNYQLLKQHHADQALYAVIKTDAYGHDASLIAQQLAPYADGFCVATLAEAIELRQWIKQHPICIMHGPMQAEDWLTIEHLNLDSCLHSLFQWETFMQHNFTHYPRLWVKVNTGMNRLGLTPEQVRKILPHLAEHQPILFSHYACAETLDSTNNQLQQSKFQCLMQAFPQCKTSVANSAVLSNPNLHNGDIIRAGIALYGHAETQLNLQPAMTFEAPVIAIQPIQKGERVGYGQRWSAPCDGYLAIIRAGYADGYPRSLPDQTPVYINGATYPLAGSISMDLSTLFLGANQQGVSVGDWAELWGENISLMQIATLAQTIPYELLCRLNQRVKKIYLLNE